MHKLYINISADLSYSFQNFLTNQQSQNIILTNTTQTKLYDNEADALYYFDRISGSSQWERPDSYDENSKDEGRSDLTRETLKKFYTLYNPKKLPTMNEIMLVYKGNYTALFIELAERYKLEDLSIFNGIDLD